MGRGKKRRKAKLKKKRMIKIRQGKRVPFSISNCPKPLRGTMYKYEYKVNVHHCTFSNARFNNVRYREVVTLRIRLLKMLYLKRLILFV